MRTVLGSVTVLAVLLAGCGGGSPTAPATPAIALTGTYSGTVSDSTGSGTTTWSLTQAGTSVTGAMTASTTVGDDFTGTITGDLSAGALTFSIAVPTGGIVDFPACAATITGSATATSTEISGTYTGTNTCSGSFTGGVLTLKKKS